MMKQWMQWVPLSKSPFPAAQFTHDECLSFQHQALSLVDECLDDFDEFVIAHHRSINKRKWKQIKVHENISVYKNLLAKEDTRMARSQISSFHTKTTRDSRSSSLSSSHSYVPDFESQTPQLIAVGTIVGSLEDVMYGIVAPTKETMRINATYLDNTCIDSSMLCPMQSPTKANPFHFLGIKWIVRSQESIVRPRDLVFLESTGVKTRSNGERIGFWVQHSVDLPQFNELKALGMVRSRQSWVSVFRETINGEVELYMRMFTDPGSEVPERVAMKAAANTLLIAGKIRNCTHNKKLVWLLSDVSSKRDPKDVVKAKGARATHCQLCYKASSMFTSLTMCELCLHKACSRCSTSRKLVKMRTADQVSTVSTSFCKNCITRGNKISALNISIEECIPEAPAFESGIIKTDVFNRKRGDSTQSTPSSSIVSYASSTPTDDTADPMNDSRRGGTPILPYERPMHERVVIPAASHYVRSQASPYSMSPQSPDMPRQPFMPSQNYSTGYSNQPFRREEPRQALWEQMNQLRLQAEEAYLQTKRNGYEISEIQ